MKTIKALFLLIGFAVSAQATTFTFTPSDTDMADFDHHYANTWGVTATSSGASYSTLKTQLASGYTITSVTLTINNIWDWVVEPNDRLWLHLLDNPLKGYKEYQDNPNDIETPADDYFAGQGTRLDTPTTPNGYWTDPAGGTASTFDLVVTFTAAQRTALKNYITNGGYTSATNGYADFGFGFDADCHYYNDGVVVVVNTAPAVVPDGGLTAMLMGLGLMAIAAVRRFTRA